MIKISFKLHNPFYRNSNNNFKNYYSKNWQLTQNKSFEFQICKLGSIPEILALELDTRFIGRDHAGINFNLDLLGYAIILNLYDRRHWDFENAKWHE